MAEECVTASEHACRQSRRCKKRARVRERRREAEEITLIPNSLTGSVSHSLVKTMAEALETSFLLHFRENLLHLLGGHLAVSKENHFGMLNTISNTHTRKKEMRIRFLNVNNASSLSPPSSTEIVLLLPLPLD
jgi:hypothetical protein